MTTFRRRAAAALLLAFATAVVSPASAAHALSCAAEVPSSPYAFRGLVERVEHRGQLAHVTTDDGRQVVVDARPGDGMGQAWGVRYRVGQRYEFHPGNAASPYTDGLCSRSRLLVSETLATGVTHTTRVAVETAPPPPPSTYSAGLVLSAVFVAGPLVGAVAWLCRRRNT